MQCLAKPSVCVCVCVHCSLTSGSAKASTSRSRVECFVSWSSSSSQYESVFPPRLTITPFTWCMMDQMIIYDPSSSATATHTVFTFCLGLGFWLRRASESRNHEFRRRSQTSQRFWSQMSPRSYGSEKWTCFRAKFRSESKKPIMFKLKKVEKKDWNWRKKPAKNGKRTKHGNWTENDKNRKFTKNDEKWWETEHTHERPWMTLEPGIWLTGGDRAIEIDETSTKTANWRENSWEQKSKKQTVNRFNLT